MPASSDPIPSIADIIGWMVAAAPGLAALIWNYRNLPKTEAGPTIARLISYIEQARTEALTAWATQPADPHGRYVLPQEKMRMLMGLFVRIQAEIDNLKARGLLWTESNHLVSAHFNQALTLDSLNPEIRISRLNTEASNLITALETARFSKWRLLHPKRQPTPMSWSNS